MHPTQRTTPKVSDICVHAGGVSHKLFEAMPVGAIVLEKTPEGRFKVLEVNPRAHEEGAWRTIKIDDLRGKLICEVFEGIRGSGLLELYEEAFSHTTPGLYLAVSLLGPRGPRARF